MRRGWGSEKSKGGYLRQEMLSGLEKLRGL